MTVGYSVYCKMLCLHRYPHVVMGDGKPVVFGKYLDDEKERFYRFVPFNPNPL